MTTTNRPTASEMLAHTHRLHTAHRELLAAMRAAEAAQIPTEYLRPAARELSDAILVAQRIATSLSATEFWTLGAAREPVRAPALG